MSPYWKCPCRPMPFWLNLQMSIVDNPRMNAMNAQTQAKYEARARIIKAMAHPKRLFVRDELTRGGPQCVQELTEMVGVSRSTVSRHLAMLQNAGLVEHEKRGSQVNYRIRCGCTLTFLDCVESVMNYHPQGRRKRLAN
jgi:DNA-binding transcriptional ArsR family regulator